MFGEIWQGKCWELFANVPGSADKTNYLFSRSIRTQALGVRWLWDTQLHISRCQQIQATRGYTLTQMYRSIADNEVNWMRLTAEWRNTVADSMSFDIRVCTFNKHIRKTASTKVRQWVGLAVLWPVGTSSVSEAGCRVTYP
jgi:hypothetical protein